MIRKGCSEEAWANDVNDVPQRRAKTAADKNQDIVHLSFSAFFVMAGLVPAIHVFLT
jgi:hypothetical protein